MKYFYRSAIGTIVFIIFFFVLAVTAARACGDVGDCYTGHSTLNRYGQTNWFSYSYYYGGRNKPGFWEVMRATPKQKYTAKSEAWSNDFGGQMKNFGLYSSYNDT